MADIDLSTLTLEELESLRKRIDEEIVRRRKAIGLNPGDKVRHRRKPDYGIGTVIEIARSGLRARVEWESPRWFDAYYLIDHLERVEEAER